MEDDTVLVSVNESCLSNSLRMGGIGLAIGKQCWNFRTRYENFRCIRPQELSSLKWCSMSFQSHCFSASGQRVNDFLLVINSNVGHIWHHFWDTTTYWL